MSKAVLTGICDMHVHTAPDLRTRAYTDFEMMGAGIRVGARAIVLKSHHGTTMNRAFLCNEHKMSIIGYSIAAIIILPCHCMMLLVD